jgi:GTP-binding protein EngB required for normal cell division
VNDAGRLAEITRLAGEVGAAGLERAAGSLAQRLAEGRFYVACLGQFKRGKSTLLNALVGHAVLPTGVAPVTSVVTVIRYGERRAARVRLRDEGWREISAESLADYVTEERNPGNRKGVAGIEVFEPSPVLRNGLCLVDTPGVGSVFLENTAATREFLPQVDAALIVLGADPPVTAEELTLIEALGSRPPHRLIVLAKADRMSDLERREALDFTKRVLGTRLKGQVGPVFEVSAAEVLATGTPSHDWTEMVAALEELSTGAGADLVAAAEQRGTSVLAGALVSAVEEQLAVLERPVVESEARIAALRAGVSRAERSIADLAPLFAAEESRLAATIEREREGFFRDAGSLAEKELESSLRFIRERGPALRQRALEEAVGVARRWLGEWQARKATEVEALFREAMRRFVELLAGVEQELRRAVPAGGATLLAPEPGLRAPSRFYMTELLAVAPASFGSRLLDVAGAASERRNQAIRSQALEYLGRLLEVNSARIKNDFRERLTTSRRELETEIKGRLRETTTTAERQLAHARRVQEAGAAQVASERERLQQLLMEARDIRERALAAGSTSSQPENREGEETWFQ